MTGWWGGNPLPRLNAVCCYSEHLLVRLTINQRAATAVLLVAWPAACFVIVVRPVVQCHGGRSPSWLFPQ